MKLNGNGKTLLILTDQLNPIKNPNQLGVTFMFDTILKGRHEH